MKTKLTMTVVLLLGACRQGTGPIDAGRPDSEVAPDAGLRVRQASAAGRFYPLEAAARQAAVKGYLSAAEKVAGAPVRMILTPHAGYEFSGAIAAKSMRQLDPGFERAVIIAANHTNEADYAGISVDTSTHLELPGLRVPIAPIAAELLKRPGFVEAPLAHASHIIEIELPFLTEVKGGAPFQIVPLVAGRMGWAEIRAAADVLAGLANDKTVFVFSVDLSHYYPYAQAVALDRPCLAAIGELDDEAVSQCDTDGTHVLALMVELASRLASTPRLLTYANSGDVLGDKSRVVGYGAMIFEDRFLLTKTEGRSLLALARAAVEAAAKTGVGPGATDEVYARTPRLAIKRSAFVTLKKKGQLRGCIGSLSAERSLAADVAENAVSAALRDPRFRPVRPEELKDIALSISVLDAPRPLEGVRGDALLERLNATHPGLVLHFAGRRSTFLPEVWEELSDAETFLKELCLKQRSPEGCWRSEGARFETYGAQHLAERL